LKLNGDIMTDLQKFANAMRIIGEAINELPRNKMLLANEKMQDHISKLLESKDPITAGGHARVIAMIARDITKASGDIALAASIKEQYDYAVEQTAQSNENFMAAIEGRHPVKLNPRRVK
jgi:hypothetical protein